LASRRRCTANSALSEQGPASASLALTENNSTSLVIQGEIPSPVERCLQDALTQLNEFAKRRKTEQLASCAMEAAAAPSTLEAQAGDGAVLRGTAAPPSRVEPAIVASAPAASARFAMPQPPLAATTAAAAAKALSHDEARAVIDGHRSATRLELLRTLRGLGLNPPQQTNVQTLVEILSENLPSGGCQTTVGEVVACRVSLLPQTEYFAGP
jgi:hypothetical protein